jgi:hypothetical protein
LNPFKADKRRKNEKIRNFEVIGLSLARKPVIHDNGNSKIEGMIGKILKKLRLSILANEKEQEKWKFSICL